MASKNNSNGEHQTTTKPPPLPSPLRFSKFFQVKYFSLFFFSFIMWLWFVIFVHLGSCLSLLAFIGYNFYLFLTCFVCVYIYILFLCSSIITVLAAFALSNIDLVSFFLHLWFLEVILFSPCFCTIGSE